MQKMISGFNILELLSINGELSLFHDDQKSYSRSEIVELIKKEQYQFIIKAHKNDPLISLLKILKAFSINLPCLIIHSKAPDTEISEINFLNEVNADYLHKLGAGVFLRTSGTSSKIKNYFFTYENIISVATEQARVLNIAPNEKIGLNLPINHVSGFMLLFRAIVSFSQLKMSSEKNHFSDIDHLSLVPAQLEIFLNDQEAKTSFKQFKSLLIGGSSLPEHQKNILNDSLIPFFESYGSTETLGFAFLNGKNLNHVQFIQNQDSTLTLFSQHLPAVKLTDKGLEPTFFIEKGLTLNDIMEVKSFNLNDHKVIFKRRKDLVFQVGAENFDPLIYENFLVDFLKDQAHQFLFLPFPDYKLENVPALILITNQTLDPIYQKDLEENIYLHLRKYILPFLMPRKFLAISFSEYFQEKIGRQKILHISQKKIFETLFDVKKNAMATRTAAVFLHGFMGNHDEFKSYQTNEVAQYFITLPWHSETASDQCFLNRENVQLYLNKFLMLLADEYESIHLIAYSMGGRLLLQSLDHNLIDKKIKIYLISTSFGLQSEKEKMLRKEYDKTLFKNIHHKNDFHVFLKKWYAMTLFSKPNHQSLDSFRNLEGDFSLVKNYQTSLEVLGAGTDPIFDQTIKKLKNLKNLKNCSLTLINGEFDHKYIKISHDVQESLKEFKVQQIIIKNAFHDPHRTHVSEITKILKFTSIPD